MFLTPALMRDVLLQLATTGIFRVKWSEDIHREWIQALMRKEPNRNRAALERTRSLMDRATPGCLVTGYTSLIPFPVLPDPNDRHVLAAAIVGRCDVIVTQNQKDFPKEALEPFGIETRHPDEFLCSWLALAPELFCSALRKNSGASQESTFHFGGRPCDPHAAGVARRGDWRSPQQNWSNSRICSEISAGNAHRLS